METALQGSDFSGPPHPQPPFQASSEFRRQTPRQRKSERPALITSEVALNIEASFFASQLFVDLFE